MISSARPLLFISCMLLLAAGAVCGDTDILLSTRHSGTINDIAFDLNGTYLFTAGEDGTVRIWDRKTTKVIQTYRISYLPLMKLAVNPERREMAVLEQGALNQYTISVWNWEDGQKLFSYQLDEIPMQLSYSPGGSYLVFSRTAWDSLTVLDSSSGRVLPYLRRGFGIVSNFLLSSSEQTIMTYHPSGSIQYREIRSGKEKEILSAPPELKAVGFSGNRRYMSGYAAGSLQVIDLVSGKPVAQQPSSALEWTAFDASSRRVFALHTDDEGSEVSVYSFNGNALNLFRRLPLKGAVSASGYFSTLYVSTLNAGVPSALNINTRLQKDFIAADLADITDMAFLENTAVFVSPETIYICTSDLFSQDSPGDRPDRFRVSVLNNPFEDTTGVTAYRDGTFIVWKKEGNGRGMFSFLDTKSGILGQPEMLPSPLRSLAVQGNSALTLEKNGTCSLINLETMETSFSFSSFGIQTVCFAGYSRIVAGKSKSSGFDSSLMEINITTGETVLIEDSNLFTYDLEYDARSKQIYSLGIQQNRGALKTVFKVHSGSHFEYGRVLSTFDEEDATASIAADSGGGYVYTSLGFDLIRQFQGYSIRMFEKTPRIPRQLAVYGPMVYSINNDRSISVWDGSSGRNVTDFYMLHGEEWIALFDGGTFAGTPGAREFLSAPDRLRTR